MMILIAGILFGVFTGGVAVVLSRRRLSRQLITQRLGSETADNPLTSTARSLETFLKSKKQKSQEVSLENLGSDRIAQDLFLAGIYDPHVGRLFRLLIKSSVWIPLLLIGINLLSGRLTLKNAVIDALVGFAIYAYVHLSLRAAKQKRQKKILRSLPQIMDLLTVCVEAGLGFMAALERILKEMDPKDTLVKELKLMYHEYLGGLSLAQACERLDKRCGVADLSVLLTFVVQSDQMGSSLGRTLRMQAVEIRDKLRQRVRAKALRIPVKILFPMMLVFLAFMIFNFALVGFQIGKAFSSFGNPHINTKALAP